jgi:hypothetical protein|nr:MAG TPA: hypothetical protein [Caudoviricetes sp.]
MSETVGRKGKLTLCKQYKDAKELQSNLKNFWQSVPIEERNIYYRDVEEVDKYGLEDNGYVVINGNCIYKVELDKDFDAYDNFVEITQIQDGVYKFVTQFYNGSTDLQEMLQEGFDQTRKKMPMIYEVRVRVVKEGTVFVEAKTQDEAEKAATRDSVVSKPGFADTIEYYADEIYNADSTVDKSDIEIIKAEDVL